MATSTISVTIAAVVTTCVPRLSRDLRVTSLNNGPSPELGCSCMLSIRRGFSYLCCERIIGVGRIRALLCPSMRTPPFLWGFANTQTLQP